MVDAVQPLRSVESEPHTDEMNSSETQRCLDPPLLLLLLEFHLDILLVLKTLISSVFLTFIYPFMRKNKI